MNLLADDFSIQAFLSQILLHLEKVDHQDLNNIFHGMLEKPPPLNHPLETKPFFFKKIWKIASKAFLLRQFP